MAAGEEWDAIQADPEFQAQPASERNRVALSFFSKRIAPGVPPEQQDAVRHEFFADAFKAPEAAPAPSKLSMAGSAMKDTLKGDVPYLALVAEAVRTKAPDAIYRAGQRIGLPTTGAVLGAGVGTVGQLLPKSGADLAIAGLGGPILEGAGTLGAKAAPTVVSTLTRRSLPEAERAISRAKELMNPTLLKPETLDNATQALGDSIKSARSALGRRLGIAEDAAAAKLPGRVVSASNVGDELADNLRKVGYSVDGKALGDIPKKAPSELQDIVDKLRNLDAGTPAIPEKPSQIRGPYGEEVMIPGSPEIPRAPRPLSLPDAIQLKRDIYDMVSYDKSKLLGLGDKETTFLKDAAKNLDDHIRALGGDELNAATDKFSRMAKGYDRLSKNALSGKVDTISKRLGRIFTAGDIERKVSEPLAAVGAGQKALDTVLDAKTAQGFAPKINPMLAKAATTTGGGILGASGALATKMAVGGPKAAAAGLATVAATSPALHNALIRAAVVPIGKSAVVDTIASPAARAIVASPLMRRLQAHSKGK